MHLYPEMESLLSKVAAREMKNRLFGYFGSFTWASAAVKKLGEFTEKLKFEVVGNPVEMKQSMKPTIMHRLRNWLRQWPTV